MNWSKLQKFHPWIILPEKTRFCKISFDGAVLRKILNPRPPESPFKPELFGD